MKILVKSSYLILLAFTVFLNFQLATGAWFPDGRNFGFLERFTCRTYPGSKVSNVTCLMKYIDRDNLKVHLSINLTEPLKDMWIHIIAYYKFNTYQKIATEYWDNPCEWMAGRRTSYLLDFFKHLTLKYSNFNHTCPYPKGIIEAKMNNISAQEFTFPQIVPAGRYRLDMSLTEGDQKKVLANGSFYGSISDHRIEVV